MTDDRDFEPTTKQTCAQVAKGKNEKKDVKNANDIEKMITLQQNHDINSLDGETNEHSMCEAQMLADVICDFNETFKNEENFTSSWQQSYKEEDHNEFSGEVNEPMKDEAVHEQHVQ